MKSRPSKLEHLMLSSVKQCFRELLRRTFSCRNLNEAGLRSFARTRHPSTLASGIAKGPTPAKTSYTTTVADGSILWCIPTTPLTSFTILECSVPKIWREIRKGGSKAVKCHVSILRSSLGGTGSIPRRCNTTNSVGTGRRNGSPTQETVRAAATSTYRGSIFSNCNINIGFKLGPSVG